MSTKKPTLSSRSKNRMVFVQSWTIYGIARLLDSLTRLPNNLATNYSSIYLFVFVKFDNNKNILYVLVMAKYFLTQFLEKLKEGEGNARRFSQQNLAKMIEQFDGATLTVLGSKGYVVEIDDDLIEDFRLAYKRAFTYKKPHGKTE